MSAATIPLAFNTDFELIDRSHYECTPQEIALYISMLAVIRPGFSKWNQGISQQELERIADLGAPYGLDAKQSHRFITAMAMLEARRKISHQAALGYFRSMHQPAEE